MVFDGEGLRRRLGQAPALTACLADLEAIEQAKCRSMAGGGAGKLARREVAALQVRTSACSSWLPGCCHEQPSCAKSTKRRVLKRVGKAVEVLQGERPHPRTGSSCFSMAY